MEKSQVRVVNGRKEHGIGVWVDRRSPLGNPFKLTAGQDRDFVVQAYSNWLDQQCEAEPETSAKRMLDWLVGLAQRPEGVTLVCWCAPEACHAEVIAHAIRQRG